MSFLSDILREAGLNRRDIRAAINEEGGSDFKIMGEDERRRVLKVYAGVDEGEEERGEKRPQPNSPQESWVEPTPSPPRRARRKLDFDEEEEDEDVVVSSSSDDEDEWQDSSSEEPKEDVPLSVYASVYLISSKPTPFSIRLREHIQARAQTELMSVPPEEFTPEMLGTLTQVWMACSKPTAFATRVMDRVQAVTNHFLPSPEAKEQKDEIVYLTDRIRHIYPRIDFIDPAKRRRVAELAVKYHIQAYGTPPTKMARIIEGQERMVNVYTKETADVALDPAVVKVFGEE